MIIENDKKMMLDFWFKDFITGSSVNTLTRSKSDEVAEQVYHYERVESPIEEERAFMDGLNAHRYFVQRLIFEFISLLVEEQLLDIEIGFCARHTDVEIWVIMPDDEEGISDKLIDIKFKAAKKYSSLDCRFTLTYFEKRDQAKFPKDFILLGSNLQN